VQSVNPGFLPPAAFKNPTVRERPVAACGALEKRTVVGTGECIVGSAIDRQFKRLGGYEKNKTPPPSPLDGVPREALRMMLDAINKDLAGPVVAEQPQPRRLPATYRRA
jgi:hypothetical protein